MSKSATTMLNVVRTGLTAWDQEQRLHGTTDLPMSPAGRSALTEEIRQVHVARTRVVHHPGDEAATETARLFAEHVGAKTRRLDDLADPDFGVLDGMTERVFADRFAKRHKLWLDDPLALSPPDGEDFAIARSRIFGAIVRLTRKSRGEDVGIVLHDIGLGLLRCWLADLPSGQLWRLLRERPHVERYALSQSVVTEMEAIAHSTAPAG